jgi:hypothetical protein
MSVFIIADPAFPDSDEDDCGYITTWSESDTNLGGSYTTPVRFGFDNNPGKYATYFASANHDHTGFLAAYSISGWGDIDLEVRIASFESDAVALSEFNDWADQHCIARDNYFGITKKEGASCYVESWQRDPKTGEIIGCNTLWITEVYRGCVITVIDSGLAGLYIPDANGCDNVKLIHYDVLNKAKELIDEKCESASIIIYPHEEYIDKGEILLKYVPDTEVYLNISEGARLEFDDPGSDGYSATVITDGKGEARIRVKYTFLKLEDMQDHPEIRVDAYIRDQQDEIKRIATYEYNVSENFDQLLEEFEDPELCPGARSNPCDLWFQKVVRNVGALKGDATWLFAMISKVHHFPFYTYKGQSDFLSGPYQARLMSWFYNKRFHKNKKIAARVNGIECLPYDYASFFPHNTVGIFPAGIRQADKHVPAGLTTWFLDPFWEQKPQVLSPSDEQGYISWKKVPGTIANIIEVGKTTIITFSLKAFVVVLNGIFGTDVGLDLGTNVKNLFIRITSSAAGGLLFDSDYESLIDIVAGSDHFDASEVTEIMKTNQIIPDPECPSLDLREGYNSALVQALRKAHFVSRHHPQIPVLRVRSPVAAKVKAPNAGYFKYNLVNNTYSGDFPALAIYSSEGNGTSMLDLVPYEKNFEVEITALDQGKLTFQIIRMNKQRMAMFNNIQINKGETYNLGFSGDEGFESLKGPKGIVIPPEILLFSNSMPWIPLLLF